MIYFLYGNDFNNKIKKLDELKRFFAEKKPEALLVELYLDNYTDEKMDELVVSQGLFEKKFIVIAKNLLENKKAREYISKKIKDIAGSENIFIFEEEEVDEKTSALFKENAYKTQEFSIPQQKSRAVFNIFTITDHIGRRDKKNAWIVLQQAQNRGIEPEEIHGVVFWQIKNMLLTKDKTAADPNLKKAGLSPFVQTKSLNYSKNFEEKELISLSSELVSLYHNAHRGLIDLDLGLEKFILEKI